MPNSENPQSPKTTLSVAAYGRLWARTATERAALRLYHRGVLVIVAAVPFAVVGIVLWPATLLLPDSLVVGVIAVTAIPVALAMLLAAALLLTSMAAAGIEPDLLVSQAAAGATGD